MLIGRNDVTGVTNKEGNATPRLHIVHTFVGPSRACENIKCDKPDKSDSSCDGGSP
jgi:hypothetical protein